MSINKSKLRKLENFLNLKREIKSGCTGIIISGQDLKDIGHSQHFKECKRSHMLMPKKIIYKNPQELKIK